LQFCIYCNRKLKSDTVAVLATQKSRYYRRELG